jgi:DNA helicase II / ATP-dependent DNA helicase PcrA
MGWFSFLMGRLIGPYLPRLYTRSRLRGLNFEGEPNRYATGRARFLDRESQAYKLHLAQLALEVKTASGEASLERLGRIYDEIYIDEVQDLNGYDLEVLLALIESSVELHLVGDVRQAILKTNAKDPKNKQYKGVKIKDWFDAQEKVGLSATEHQGRTWRCNQSITDFADSIFDEAWGFPKAQSMNTRLTGHDGVFQVAEADVSAYVQDFSPLCLRYNKNTARNIGLPFMNIGIAKGMDVERVLLWPTKDVGEIRHAR